MLSVVTYFKDLILRHTVSAVVGCRVYYYTLLLDSSCGADSAGRPIQGEPVVPAHDLLLSTQESNSQQQALNKVEGRRLIVQLIYRTT